MSGTLDLFTYTSRTVLWRRIANVVRSLSCRFGGHAFRQELDDPLHRNVGVRSRGTYRRSARVRGRRPSGHEARAGRVSWPSVCLWRGLEKFGGRARRWPRFGMRDGDGDDIWNRGGATLDVAAVGGSRSAVLCREERWVWIKRQGPWRGRGRARLARTPPASRACDE